MIAEANFVSGRELPTLLENSSKRVSQQDNIPLCKNADGKKAKAITIQEDLFLAGMSNYWKEWLPSLHAAIQYHNGPAEEPMASFEEVFQASMKDYVNAVALELEFEEKLSLDQYCDQTLDDYMKFRVDASGAFPMFALAMLFRGVPAAHWQDKDWQRLRWLAGAIVAIDNDIISYHKDDSMDYVKLQMSAAHCSEADALAATKQYHHNLIAEYNEIAQLLYCRYPGDESITFWVDKVFPVWLRGGFLWQCEARRYQLKDRNIMQELFPDFVSPELNLDEARSISEEAKEWGMLFGLLTDVPSACDQRYPAKKWDGLDVGRAVLRVYAYADISQHGPRQILRVIAKFLGWFFVVDDVLEVKARHEAMQSLVLDCLETLPLHQCE